MIEKGTDEEDKTAATPKVVAGNTVPKARAVTVVVAAVAVATSNANNANILFTIIRSRGIKWKNAVVV